MALGRELRLGQNDIAHRWRRAYRAFVLGRRAEPGSGPEAPDRGLDPDLAEVLDAVAARLGEPAGGDASPEAILHYHAALLEAVRAWLQEEAVDASLDEYAALAQTIFARAVRAVRRAPPPPAGELGADFPALLHKLRTPLTALSLQLNLLDRAHATAVAPVLARLRRNVRRMRFLLDGMSRLGGYVAQTARLRPKQIQASRLVADLLLEHEPEAARKRLLLATRVDATLVLRVDPDLLGDALSNLVHNAVRYTARGEVRVEVDATAAEVVFRVHDTGPGLDPEARRAVEGAAAAGLDAQRGLGLRIAAHAARVLDGELEVEATGPDGSCLRLRLPR